MKEKMTNYGNHEECLIKSFVAKDKQDRYLKLLSSPKGRQKFRSYIAHFKDLDKSLVHKLSAKEQNIHFIKSCLKNKGASEDGYIICESSDYDGLQAPINTTLNNLFGQGIGYFISCIPGKLVYYEGEDTGERYLCEVLRS